METYNYVDNEPFTTVINEPYSYIDYVDDTEMKVEYFTYVENEQYTYTINVPYTYIDYIF